MVANRRPSLGMALTPVIFLIIALALNVFIFSKEEFKEVGADPLSGSNQMILIIAGLVAGGMAIRFGKSWEDVFEAVSKSIMDTTKAILILLMIGALAGGWLISGVIPAFVHYGIQIMNPNYFLPAAIIISAIISVATGSSWNTTATIGLAFMGIGSALGFSPPITAGAVISGAYFGDKMSPLSDTTNLAPAMAGTDLVTHIRYMTITTVPSIIITIIVFTLIGLFGDTNVTGTSSLNISEDILARFNITPWLMLVPLVTLGLIIAKVDAVISILVGALAGGVFALIFQPHIVAEIAGVTSLDGYSGYLGVFRGLTEGAQLGGDHPVLGDLLNSSGMSGMMTTIWLIISAMFFGGAMQSAGFLRRISQAIVSLTESAAGLITSTIGTGFFLNLTASDQYLAIVIPGKMYKDIYKERGLAPENLSRSLEDSGTVTSALVPWNTCGAYQSSALGVATGDYFIYAIFNWLSPMMSIAFAYLNIKIKRTKSKTSPSDESSES
ncbi:Na+/H+ antiporter NhaC [Phaeocystidibacter marisrubri]|uniref:Na+/H+ antiporter NhaC n=1 Tax=Phaeocystidibacter marisrubri TaxID=1577780 RepID=A0A6L3ZJV2_9FLAO|nr:Na+/H+ antiporter NhaC [Phaeocystidibacter marisrubri]KAB2818181.1 Na+/H+ antiporter NhaC [Phaeocystidibacter marisrubri]GGH71530.1 sodium:proton antiporter [Phaeocystidibacter marisrubri]